MLVDEEEGGDHGSRETCAEGQRHAGGEADLRGHDQEVRQGPEHLRRDGPPPRRARQVPAVLRGRHGRRDRRAGAGRLHRQLHQSLQRRPASGARSRVRVVAAVVVVVLALAVPAAAQIYQWTDTEGVTRYTNDRESIPPEYRERAREIDSPQARPEEPGRVEVPATDPSVIPITGAGPIRTSVSINGVGLTPVLGTGADRTVISPAAFARTGLDTGSSPVVSIIRVPRSAPAREVTVPLLDAAGGGGGAVWGVGAGGRPAGCHRPPRP